jgi:DNA-directed RNA polymerase subunit RPC12/RpoP
MTTVTATCSDCLMTQQIELNPRRTEIRCEYCGHSVPMFQKKEMADITASLRAERNRNLIAFAIFLAAAAFFGVYVFFTLLGEPPVVVATAPGTEGGEKQYRLIRRDDEKAEKQLAVEHLETGEPPGSSRGSSPLRARPRGSPSPTGTCTRTRR